MGTGESDLVLLREYMCNFTCPELMHACGPVASAYDYGSQDDWFNFPGGQAGVCPNCSLLLTFLTCGTPNVRDERANVVGSKLTLQNELFQFKLIRGG